MHDVPPELLPKKLCPTFTTNYFRYIPDISDAPKAFVLIQKLAQLTGKQKTAWVLAKSWQSCLTSTGSNYKVEPLFLCLHCQCNFFSLGTEEAINQTFAPAKEQFWLWNSCTEKVLPSVAHGMFSQLSSSSFRNRLLFGILTLCRPPNR